MKTFNTLLLLVTLFLAATAQAQNTENNTRGREALKMGLYPPDMIMRHQQRLGITAAQRKRMAESVKRFQSEVAELQWNLQSEQQALKQLLDRYRIDNEEALEHVDKVMALENEFKKAHFRLLIAIKNELSEAQIDMINQQLSQRRAGS